ncbi:MAG: ribonuclease P protein component [Flavobacteriaceae bacterium]
MKFTYPKNEKLKKRKLIEKLFTQGKSVAKYPLRLVYMEVENAEEPFQLSVSVSKKYFKKAVDRNRFKRMLRETYRLNQHLLKENVTKSYVFMLLYQSKDVLSFEEIHQKTIELFEKFKSLQEDSK